MLHGKRKPGQGGRGTYQGHSKRIYEEAHGFLAYITSYCLIISTTKLNLNVPTVYSILRPLNV